MFSAVTFHMLWSVVLPKPMVEASPDRRSRYRSYLASSPVVDVIRAPTSTVPVMFSSGAAGVEGACCACACARVAEASSSAPVTIINRMRIAVLLAYRRNLLPDGWFEP